MRKWIYTTLGHMGTVTTAIDGDTIEAESGTEFYTAADVHALLKLIACQDEGCGGNLRPEEIYRSMQKLARRAIQPGAES